MRCGRSINKWFPAITLVLTGVSLAAGPVGTGFSYQGQVKELGVPLNATADFQFVLWDAESGGSQVGSTVAVNNVNVVNGLFTAQVDFGAGMIAGDARWLQVSMRSPAGSGAFTPLNGRQPITAAPVAAYALAGPGSGGFWAANGDDIYNNNLGYVGVGTSSPRYNLHVYQRASGGFYPPARIGAQWFRFGLPIPESDWFAIEVGGDGVGWGPGTRLVRESGTTLVFQTEESMNAAVRSTQMVLDANGNIGLGTTTPDSRLHVIASGSQRGIYASSTGVGIYGLHNSTSGTFPGVWGDTSSLSSGAAGVRGIVTSTSPGSGSAGVLGYNKSTTMNGYGVRGVHDGYGVGVYGVSANGIGVYGESTNGTYAGWFEGRVRTSVLEIAGADLAEKFPMSETVQPGMVVAIDPKHPGKLRLSRQAYDRCVAGVVSGANDLQAGAVLGHLPGSGSAPPIALSGRVWVHCDATRHPIVPGDLLTPSDVAGHAMKVTDHLRGQGAIIGKAMTGLDSGRGMVLVLVSLQ